MDDVMGRAANTLQPQFRHVHTSAATFTQFLRPHTNRTCHVTFAERYRCARVDAEFRIALDAWFTRIPHRNHSSDAPDECNTGLALIYGLANHVPDRRFLAALRSAFLQANTRRYLGGQCNAARDISGMRLVQSLARGGRNR